MSSRLSQQTHRRKRERPDRAINGNQRGFQPADSSGCMIFRTHAVGVGLASEGHRILPIATASSMQSQRGQIARLSMPKAKLVESTMNQRAAQR